MQVYSIGGSRIGNLVAAAIVMVLAFGILGGALVAVIRTGGSRAPVSAAILVLFALVLVGVMIVMLDQMVEIRVSDDGTVDFVRPLRTTRITVWQIWALEGTIGSDYGRTTWSLRVQHARGAMHFGEFRNVKHFAQRVKTLNPEVEISGVWPMGAPQPPPRLPRLR